ncbi:MAG: hypothetical protein IJU19_04290 [Bacteroidales bacterium]|nr:hypothetical protein [Bacteroidales bacterium]
MIKDSFEMKSTLHHLLPVWLLMAFALVGCADSESDADSGVPTNEARAVAFTGEGATNGLFAVGERHYVRFSRGNLQYQASSAMWRFAPQQYQVVGEANARLSATTAEWIDLFGWGTSGWNSGAAYYRPFDNHPDSRGYAPHGDTRANIDTTLADWGRAVAIVNGGGQEGLWRTLTQAEWNYLLGSSESEAYGRAGRWAAATVEGVPGLLLLPNRRVGADGQVYLWRLPSDVRFTEGQAGGWSTNVYSGEQWERLERCGVVFLPAAQLRNNSINAWGVVSSTYIGITDGYYWSSTAATDASAYAVSLSAEHKVLPMDRQYGLSVRLVADYAR